MMMMMMMMMMMTMWLFRGKFILHHHHRIQSMKHETLSATCAQNSAQKMQPVCTHNITA
jgi:hypothetical protein